MWLWKSYSMVNWALQTLMLKSSYRFVGLMLIAG